MNSEETKRIFSNKLKMYMGINNLTQKDISEITGVSQQSVSNWINAKLMPRMGVIETLANYFQIKKSELIEDNNFKKNEHNVEFITIPMYKSFISDNYLILDTNIEKQMNFPAAFLNVEKKYFGQYVSGDYLIDDRIIDGDLLIYEKTNSIHNGKVGCFRFGDGFIACGKLYRTNETIILQPGNSKYPPIVVDNSKIKDLEIIGSLVMTISMTPATHVKNSIALGKKYE